MRDKEGAVAYDVKNFLFYFCYLLLQVYIGHLLAHLIKRKWLEVWSKQLIRWLDNLDIVSGLPSFHNQEGNDSNHIFALLSPSPGQISADVGATDGLQLRKK